MKTTLSPEVRSVLERSSIEGTVVRLPEQLDRPLYVSVDKALKAIGGKWDRKVGGHVFPFDASELLGEAVESGTVVDRKKELQFFETPSVLARRMVDFAEVMDGERVLEPSAGHGRIVREIREDASVIAVEIDSVNIGVLDGSAGLNVMVVQADFLEWAKDAPAFDVIVMNPPFTRGQDIDHIRAAYGLLDEGGRLVAVCSTGPFFREDRKAREFRDWLESVDGGSELLPEDTFAESGTGVRTRLVTIRR